MQNPSMKSALHIRKKIFISRIMRNPVFATKNNNKKQQQRHRSTVRFPRHCSTLLFLFNKFCSVLITRLVLCGCTSPQLDGIPKQENFSCLCSIIIKARVFSPLFRLPEKIIFKCMIFLYIYVYPSPRSSLYLRKQYG